MGARGNTIQQEGSEDDAHAAEKEEDLPFRIPSGYKLKLSSLFIDCRHCWDPPSPLYDYASHPTIIEQHHQRTILDEFPRTDGGRNCWAHESVRICWAHTFDLDKEARDVNLPFLPRPIHLNSTRSIALAQV